MVASGGGEWGEWRSVAGKLTAEHHKEANREREASLGGWGDKRHTLEANTGSRRGQKLVQSISSMQGASNGRLALLIYNSGGGRWVGRSCQSHVIPMCFPCAKR